MLRTAISIVHFLLFFMPSKVKSAEPANALPRCPDSCGGIPIPFPFGIGPDCCMPGFEVLCTAANNGNTGPMPFLIGDSSDSGKANASGPLLLSISLSLGEARIAVPVAFQCYNGTTKEHESGFDRAINGSGTPFKLNHSKNKFTVIGCETLAYLLLGNDEFSYLGGCVSACGSLDSLPDDGSCSGVGCCQTAVPNGINYLQDFWFDEKLNRSRVTNFSHCSYAMVVEDDEFEFKTSYITSNELIGKAMPMVIDWAIGNTSCDAAQINRSSYACKSDHAVCVDSVNGPGYLCNCSQGYQGNPYLEGASCQDINECASQHPCSKKAICHNLQGGYRCSCPFGWSVKRDTECEPNWALIIGCCIGAIALLLVVFGTYVVLERRNISKVKEKYFQQHGGWILLEKIRTNQGFGFAIFTKQQVEQATNNFDNANIIGRGGHGTVYKGILGDQTVAIKRCKIVDENKKKEFGKEMLILSQISHKNIVKILGCCLEVEVPMLVYEFISNGTLFHYIHSKNRRSPISLITRLRIARESAEALAYLHTSASPPIFHGDVKSANILLDQNYIAKVSDFGASILALTNEAQLVTFVQGTLGYLDPEYMRTSKLTDKSDVYSFGVVLLELLTSKPVIIFDAREEERNLLSYFFSAMEENKLEEILDEEIRHEDDMEVIREIAELAKNCLNIKREERPMMMEVAEELHRINKRKQHFSEQHYNSEEEITLLREESHHDNTVYSIVVDKEAVESLTVGR